MKNKHVIILCFSISLIWNFSSAQTLNSKQEMSYLADTYLNKLTELKQFNGTVLLKKGDSIVLKKAYNLKNNESNTLYVSTESQYDLRSVAKLFAKVKLHEWETEGTLNLSNPLSTNIPNFPKGDSITINQLLNHTSGLPREFSSTTKPPVEMSATDIVEQAKKENLEFRPGTKTQYSNVGFQLVYYLVGQLSNNSYANAMRHSFFNPLHMNRSGSHFNDAIQNKTHYAFGHYLDDNKHIVCECSMPSDDMQLGNLYSTVSDLELFLSSLSPNSIGRMEDNTIAHAGGTKGKRAYVERNFKDEYQIIFLSNYDAIPFEKLVTDLQKIMRGQKVTMPKKVSRKAIDLNPNILESYQGTYDLVEAGHIVISFKLENGKLNSYQNGSNNGTIYAESPTVFFAEATSEESIEFVTEANGEVYVLIDFQGVRWKGIKIEAP